MPRSYRTNRTPRRLTRVQRWTLLQGPSPAREGAFKDEQAMRQAYDRHELHLLSSVNTGCRPWGFWRYRVGWHPRAGECHKEVLIRLGLLGEQERLAMALPWSASLRLEIAKAEMTRRRDNPVNDSRDNVPELEAVADLRALGVLD